MFRGQHELAAQDLHATSSTQLEKLGIVGETIDGRKFRYAKAGAVNLAAAKICVAEAVAGNHQDIAVAAAAAVGDTQVTVTLGATAATANQYAEGFLTVISSTGLGYSYRISGHPAAASAGSLTVTLDATEPLQVALATSSKVTLTKNPWKDIIVAPNAVAHRAVGVPSVALTAAYFGWVQTKGDAPVLSDGVIGKGSGAILSDAVAGAVEVEVAGTVTNRVGRAPEATVDAKYYLIDLCID